jgi:hypothetical protein
MSHIHKRDRIADRPDKAWDTPMLKALLHTHKPKSILKAEAFTDGDAVTTKPLTPLK